jgi:phytoene dehydrogenase-like protein
MTEDEIAAYRKLTIDTVQREIGDTFDDRIIEEEIFTVKDFHQRYNAFQ